MLRGGGVRERDEGFQRSAVLGEGTPGICLVGRFWSVQPLVVP